MMRTPRLIPVLALLFLTCVGLSATPRPAQARLLSGLLGGLVGTQGRTAVVVRLDGTVRTSRVVRLLRRLGFQVTRRYDKAGLVVVQSPLLTLAGLDKLLVKAGSLPGIDLIEVDRPVRSENRFGGSQSQMAAFEWDLSISSMEEQPAFRAAGLAGGRQAAEAAPTVAVLDGGFHEAHEALPASAIEGTWDALDGDADVADYGNGFDDDQDGWVDGGLGHGHAVASLVHVIAPGAPMLLARVLDDEGRGTYSTVAAGLDWALRRGARIVNLSAGAEQRSIIISNMLEEARVRGVVVVASAGNEPGEVDHPAREYSTTAVTGTHVDGMKMSGAGSGYAVDLGAPGFEIIAAWPGSKRRYGRYTGTSFATPIVVGAIARVAGAHHVSAEQAESWVLEAVQPYERRQWGAGRGMLHVGWLLP